MAISKIKVGETFINIVVDVPISCDWPLYSEDECFVFYGQESLAAVLNTDFTVDLDAPNYNTFSITPLASLLTKINDLIAANPEEEFNYITVRRTLLMDTSVLPESVRLTAFVSREFERTAMRFQQIEEQLLRAIKMPENVAADGDDFVGVSFQPGIEPGHVPVVNEDGTQIIQGPSVTQIENAQANATQTGLDVIASAASASAAANSALDAQVAKMEWRGPWSAGSYDANDVVYNTGSSWIALVTTTEEPSLFATDWGLVALRGIDGTGLTPGVKQDVEVIDGNTFVIVNNAVTTDKIINNAVVADKIADGAVTTDKIPDSAVTNAKLANMAANTVKVNATNGAAAPTDLALSASTILGRGASGDISPITLGAGLAMTGTVLDAAVGGGGLINTLYYTCPTQTVTISNASPAVFTYPNSGRNAPQNGCPVRLTTTGTLPPNFSTGVTYWVVGRSGSTSKLAATKGGAEIDAGGAGSGTHTITNAPYEKATNNPTFIKNRVVGGSGAGGSNTTSPGGGGGGGCEKTILSAELSSAETVTSGVAGITSANGGTSSFGSHCSATGGQSAGSGVALGGVGTGGDINVSGQNGFNAGSNVKIGGTSAFGLSVGANIGDGEVGIIVVEEYA